MFCTCDAALSCACPIEKRSGSGSLSGGIWPIRIHAMRMSGCLFVAQADDRIEVGRDIRRIIAEEQTHADGDRRYKSAHQGGDACSDEDADRAADQREDHGFEKKLQTDIRAACTDGLAH